MIWDKKGRLKRLEERVVCLEKAIHPWFGDRWLSQHLRTETKQAIYPRLRDLEDGQDSFARQKVADRLQAAVTALRLANNQLEWRIRMMEK